jgi:signal transduction histidine kinase
LNPSRGENARTEPGIGLGHSFVKEVAESHGGKVLGLSEPPKGSSFSILLPAGEKRKGKEVVKRINQKVRKT